MAVCCAPPARSSTAVVATRCIPCCAWRTPPAKPNICALRLRVHEWSQAQVSRSDGSWINDVTLSTWQGITVFHTIALAEALEHHGEVLDVATRAQWKDRLAAAAKFLDGFITIETGNVNYPVTATLAFQLCGQVLGEAHYFDRARALAHEVMGQFTPDGFLFGEGHPLNGRVAQRLPACGHGLQRRRVAAVARTLQFAGR